MPVTAPNVGRGLTAAPPAEIPIAPLASQEYTDSLLAALAAVALAAGGSVAAPLRLAALPLLAYMGLPAARRVYLTLRDEASLPALAETAVLGLVLVRGIALPALVLPSAVGFSLYYLGRRWWVIRTEKAAQRTNAFSLPPTVCVRRAEGDMIVPVALVVAQEYVLYTAGDLIPLAGTIVEGMAWVQPWPATSAPGATSQAPGAIAQATVRKPGATVTVGDLVLTGKLVVQCG